MVAAMRAGPPKVTVILRIDAVRKGRVTGHRLVCSDCGALDPIMRSKAMCEQEARQHAKTHPLDTVQLT